jgi:indolepyruvate ferredoxin oxidoreductase
MVEKAIAPLEDTGEDEEIATDLDGIVAKRVADLTAYQDSTYAKRFEVLVRRVQETEHQRAPGRDGLAEAVARSYYKLLAYKDEYEVARLFTDGEFERKLASQFDGNYTLEFNMAPPLLAQRDPDTGHLKKRAFGPWVFKAFKVLAGMKGLRGGAFDIFGYTAERRQERQLIADYEATVAALLDGLNSDNHGLAVDIALLPMKVRGYGHIKDKAIAETKAREAELMQSYRNPAPQATAAE